MEPPHNITLEVEHAITNSKVIEKLESELSKLKEKSAAQDILITKWLHTFIGSSTVVATCCGIICWGIVKGIDSNDKLNDAQNQKIVRVEADFTEIKEQFNLLKHDFNVKPSTISKY